MISLKTKYALKALITLAEYLDTDPAKAAEARRVIDEVLADHTGAHGRL